MSRLLLVVAGVAPSTIHASERTLYTAYGARADSGSSLTISHTTVSATTSGVRSGGVSWGSTDRTSDPKFLSLDRTADLYLTIGPSSPVYAAGSAKEPLGARAQ
jgi:hypothetical protein